MIGVTKLFCGEATSGDAIRYGHKAAPGTNTVAGAPPRSAAERRPVTVWSVTRTCNLSCIHCYTDSESKKYEGELSTEEAKAVLADLASFKVPAVLFSGGEPLARADLFELVAEARRLELRPTLSTNGTLITEETARKIKSHGFSYVGISLDGIGEVNDYFRGKKGAFRDAVKGFKNCVAAEQRVGLRLTLTGQNYKDLHRIFDFIEAEGVNRACFYHLVYSGRGGDISKEDLTHAETRRAMDIIVERTEDFHRRGLEKDILTVDNHVDGPYIYMKLMEKDPERAAEVLKLLEWNGGGRFSSGVGIGNIDFQGEVHADQFWMDHSFGNVRERPFSEIWRDQSDPLMKGLKNQKDYLKGKCTRCRFYAACGGALRVRAYRVFDTPWAPDPACYLNDEETGLTAEDRAELKSAGEEFRPPEHLLAG